MPRRLRPPRAMTQTDSGQPTSLLVQHLAHFAPRRRQLGMVFAVSRAAQITKVTPLEVRGTVSERSLRTCYLTFAANGSLSTSCTCQGPAFCEHAFALLVLEDQRRKSAAAQAPKPSNPPEPPKQPKPRKAKKVAQPQPQPAPTPPPSWRERLTAITSIALAATSIEEATPLTFRIDVDDSKRRNRLTFMILTPRDGTQGQTLQRLGRSLRLSQFAEPARRLLQMLNRAESQSSYFDIPGAHQILDEPWASRLLPHLFAAGTVTWSALADDGSLTVHELRLDEGPAYQFDAKLERIGQELLLQGKLLRGSEVVPAEQVLLLLEDCALLRDRLVRTAVVGSARALARDLLQNGAMVVPEQHESELLAELVELAADVPDLHLPVGFVDAGPPEPVFLLDTNRLISDHFVGEVQLAYGETMTAIESPTILPPLASGGPLRRRDTLAEGHTVRKLEAAAAPELRKTQMVGHYLVHRTRSGALISRLLAAGIRSLVNGRPMQQGIGGKISVHTDLDWFEVRGSVRFEGGSEVPIGAALAALQRGDSIISLADDSLGVLPTEWLAQWQQVAQLGETRSDGVRLRRSQALLLDALLAARAGTEIEADQGFRDLHARLARFSGIHERAAPAGFQGTLRPYQQAGLGWLHFLRDLHLGGCLADDMGLGKTVQVLALLLEVHTPPTEQPSLLVVPRSLLDNWRREAARFTPKLRVFDCHGTGRWERLAAAGGPAAFDLIVTTYGTVRGDISRFEEQGLRWEYAILDEAQAIENATSLTSKAVRLLRARHRLALTGTPVQNHTGELWALFEFLNPGLLGKSRTFQRLLRASNDRGEGLDLPRLHKALAPFLLRRTKASVLPDLPAKQEQAILCEMDGSQQATYAALREHYQKLLLRGEQKLGAKERFVALEALLRLRQAACHEGLLDETHCNRDSAKLDALLPMLQELIASGHKALVFSQFTAFLAIVRTRLDAAGLRYEYLDGASTKRQESVDRFQQDAQCPLFLISLKAGGFGLNLTAADYVFLLDPWWNPAAETQAADRAHRIGQTQKVTVYRLITKDTVEEKVLQLQAQKQQLVEALLGADQSLLAQLTRQDLAALLS